MALPVVDAAPGRDVRSRTEHLIAGLGFLSGFASGILGGGGGLVIVPGLILVGRVSMQRAVGASAVTVSLTSLVAVLTMATFERPSVDWWIVGLLTIGSLVGSTAAGKFLTRYPDRPVRLALSILLVFAALRLVRAAPTSGLEGVVLGSRRAVDGAAILVVRMLAGLVSVLCGIGGSLIVIPALSLIAPGLSFDIVRGTSLAVPSSALAVYQHLRRGTVDLGIVRGLGLAAIVGVVAGVIVGSALPAHLCRGAFAALLVLIALGLAMPTREPTRNRSRWSASPKPARERPVIARSGPTTEERHQPRLAGSSSVPARITVRAPKGVIRCARGSRPPRRRRSSSTREVNRKGHRSCHGETTRCTGRGVDRRLVRDLPGCRCRG
jgi:uncharacterized protein